MRSLAGGGLLLPGMLSEIMATETMTTGPMPDVDPLAPKRSAFRSQSQACHFPVHDGRSFSRRHV